MGIKHARHKERIKIRGKPTDVTKAEIMVMKQEERMKEKRKRRNLFTALDFVIIISFGLTIYSIFIKNYLNMLFFLIIGLIPLTYFIARKFLKNKKKPQKNKKR